MVTRCRGFVPVRSVCFGRSNASVSARAAYALTRTTVAIQPLQNSTLKADNLDKVRDGRSFHWLREVPILTQLISSFSIHSKKEEASYDRHRTVPQGSANAWEDLRAKMNCKTDYCSCGLIICRHKDFDHLFLSSRPKPVSGIIE